MPLRHVETSRAGAPVATGSCHPAYQTRLFSIEGAHINKQSPNNVGDAVHAPPAGQDVQRFFADWERIDPGVVPVMTWHPDQALADPQAAYYWAGPARKP